MFQLDLATSAQTPYTTSVAAITGFSSWIESQPIPANRNYNNYATVAGALTHLKQDTMAWINQVYPSCLQIVQQIQQANTGISSTLTELQTLAKQLQAQPSDKQLQTAIATAAQSLSSSVAKLDNSIGATLTPLAKSRDSLASDLNSVAQAMQRLMADGQTANQLLYDLQGRLHSLEHATCPSASSISSCSNQIQTVQDELSTISALESPCQQSQQHANAAFQGLSYLAGYWTQAHMMAGQVQTTIGQLTNVPANLLQLDLQAAQQGWQGLLQMANATLTQVTALKMTF
jgi:hypothetical protein